MPQPDYSDFSDHHPRRERRSHVPIINLPINSLSESTDPTQEIRNLLEELQKTARDARGQARGAEAERDEMERQRDEAIAKIEQLRANERELRSHFTEVSSILRERDEAVQARDRIARAEKDATEKLGIVARERNDLARQRNEAIRQRDELKRNADTTARSLASAAAQAAEAQRQVTAIRQARDSAHSQNVEITNRALRLEDEVAEIGYQRDAAKKAQAQAQTEVSEYRRQLDMMTSDRDATATQVEQLTRELDEQRKKLLDLAEQKSAEAQADNEHSAALAEARAQVASLAHERDAARQRAQDQSRELEEMRAQFEHFRDVEGQAISQELEQARTKLASLETQARESRHEVLSFEAQFIALNEQFAALQRVTDESMTQKVQAEARLAALAHEHEAAAAAACASQEQFDQMLRERDEVLRQATDHTVELEAQVAALRAQMGGVEEAQALVRERNEELREAARRFEKQRLEMLEVVIQLQAAQQQIRELSANLAEARLQVKFANSAARAAKAAPERVAEITSFANDVVNESLAEAALAHAAPLPIVDEPLSEREAKSALAAMRHCFLSFTRNPSDFSLLNELHCHIHGFSERACISGFVALHRLCHAFTQLTRSLYEEPDRVNASATRTIGQTIDLLVQLTKERQFATLKSPSTARIYVVDDDMDNCHAIEMALQEQMIQTAIAQDASCALVELSASPYDLILLDVMMPEMDGFELCKHIRELPLHETTPIVFLTGVNTPENRLQSGLSGGNDFLGKPFSLDELGVKVLTLILKSQLAPM